MSGLISLGKENEQNWTAANWAFWSLLRGVVKLLPRGDPLRERLENVETSNFEYLSLEDLTSSDLEKFARAVTDHRDHLSHQGRSEFAKPEFLPTYLESIRQLLEVLSAGLHKGNNI